MEIWFVFEGVILYTFDVIEFQTFDGSQKIVCRTEFVM